QQTANTSTRRCTLLPRVPATDPSERAEPDPTFTQRSLVPGRRVLDRSATGPRSSRTGSSCDLLGACVDSTQRGVPDQRFFPLADLLRPSDFFAWAFEIRAARCLLMPLSRSASYVSFFFTDGPGLFLPGIASPLPCWSGA